MPITKVEAKGANHDYLTLARAGDGTLTDAAGFGKGAFSIRVTGIDNQQLVDTFDWPGNGIAGATLTAADNFK